MRTSLIALPLLLSGCPYDASAAGLTAVDGGYIYGYNDASTFIPFQDVDAEVTDRLPPAPSMEKLCTLYVGDATDQTSYPKRFGTWFEDALKLFGSPPRNGIILGKDEARLSYLWRGATAQDGSELEPSGMTLSFEYVPINKLATDEDGKPEKNNYTTEVLSHSYFLNGIQMRDGIYLDCWRWELREPGRVPCTDCLDQSKWGWCARSAGNPTDCF